MEGGVGGEGEEQVYGGEEEDEDGLTLLSRYLPNYNYRVELSWPEEI